MLMNMDISGSLLSAVHAAALDELADSILK